MWQHFLDWIEWESEDRLRVLEEEAILLINRWNLRLTTERDGENQVQTGQEIAGFIARVKESRQALGFVRMLRILQGAGSEVSSMPTLREANGIIECMAVRIAAEHEGLSNRRNFRIAITTALLAIAATVLAFASAVADVWSAFFKN